MQEEEALKLRQEEDERRRAEDARRDAELRAREEAERTKALELESLRRYLSLFLYIDILLWHLTVIFLRELEDERAAIEAERERTKAEAERRARFDAEERKR